MERILASMAIIAALGFGYNFDHVAKGATYVVEEMGNELQAVYSYFKPDVRVEAKKCLDWNKQEIKEGRIHTTKYCHDMVTKWRELDGQAEVTKYFFDLPADFKPIDFAAPRP